MKFSFQKYINRSRRSILLWTRSLKAKWNRLNDKGRLIVIGSGAGIVAVLVLVIILVAVGGKDKAGEAGNESALLANVTEGPEGFIEITPSPTLNITPSSTPVPTPTPTPDPTLKRGDESPEVEALQVRLSELGYIELDETTQYFGPATEEGVRRFQRQVNFTESLGMTLEVDGIAGLNTLDIIYSDDAPKYCLLYGMEGDDITDMQDQLKDLGYMSAVTGNYLEKTVEALKDFQSENGLSSDGMCGPKTFELLYSDEALESPTKRKQARTRANINEMIAAAKEQLGDKYVLGAEGPDKFDCSGLVYYCLKEAGSNRRRLNAAGYSRVSDWEKIDSIYDLKKGDLIFFYNDSFSKIGHVGIVLNDEEMIDASNNRGKVVRRDYLTSYWKKHFYCGRRPW